MVEKKKKKKDPAISCVQFKVRYLGYQIFSVCGLGSRSWGLGNGGATCR